MKSRIIIDGFLTQSKLASALRHIVTDSSWRGEEVTLPGTRRRIDMAYRSGGTTVFIEYDGDEHYRNSLVIKLDQEKDDWACSRVFRLVRFPYWLQLDTETLERFFGLKADIEQSFPHGFITTRLFPASFCELGIERFSRELQALPEGLRSAVVTSLRDKASRHGLEYVLPKAFKMDSATIRHVTRFEAALGYGRTCRLSRMIHVI